MPYHIQNGIWQSVFAVPSEIVDKHIKLCGALSLKALLILLRRGGGVEAEELAAMLGQSVSDVRDALGYWVQLGVIAGQSDEIPEGVLLYSEIPDAALPDKSAQKREETPVKNSAATKAGRSRRRLSTQDVNELARNDKNIEELLHETQAIMGKELTPVSTDTVVALYSYYGMKPDLILMLIHHCVSLGKSNMNYIEKVAASWLELGIDTHERAEAEILRASALRKNGGEIKAMFGIRDRDLIAKEEKFIDTWVNVYKMDMSLIHLAFERTVELKGKLSFDYINGILTNWKNKGISTPAQAMEEIQRGPAEKKKVYVKKGASSYDMGELEDMISYGSLLD